MPNRLFVEKLVSVGMVEAGDNPEAEVMIYKSRDPGTKVSTNAESVFIETGERMDLSAIEDQTLRKTIEDAFAEKDAQIEKLQSQVEEPVEDPVEKAAPEVQQLVKEQQEQLAKVQEDLAKERQERLVAEHISKAEQYEPLFGKAEDVGPVLADLAEGRPDSFEKLEGWLTAAAQRSDLAELFSKKGTGSEGGEADPISKRDEWVKANKKDDESDVEANARFWKEHPEMKEEARS